MEHVIQFEQTWHKVKKIDSHTDTYNAQCRPFVFQPFSERNYHKENNKQCINEPPVTSMQ